MTHFAGLATIMTLSTEDLDNLKDRFSQLETDIDAFSTALSRLSASRRLSTGTGDIPVHGVSQRIAPSNNNNREFHGSASDGHVLLLPAVMMTVLTAAVATLAFRRARLKEVGRGPACY